MPETQNPKHHVSSTKQKDQSKTNRSLYYWGEGRREGHHTADDGPG